MHRFKSVHPIYKCENCQMGKGEEFQAVMVKILDLMEDKYWAFDAAPVHSNRDLGIG